MPIKVWREHEGQLVSAIRTNWDVAVTAEEHRASAETLDRAFDQLLDQAEAEVRRCLEANQSGVDQFVRAHAVGRTLLEFDPLSQAPLRHEPPRFVWWALATKCRVGARADGSRVETWRRELRPPADRIPRREGRRNDHFEMCAWLAQQSENEATITFGGSIRNVWQMMERPTLKPLGVREALIDWLRSVPSSDRENLTSTKAFPELMKALRRRWPATGPGSAKQPIHYAPAELRREVGLVLAPFATNR